MCAARANSAGTQYPVIGLVGLPGAGKSEVARLLETLDAFVIDVDRVGHSVLDDEAVRADLVARFGDGILAPGGAVDRKALGKIVFADAGALADLEALVHPAMVRRVQGLANDIKQTRAVVVDAALLFEMKLDAVCDTVWLVDAPLAERCRRVRARGWDVDEVQRRETRLLTIDELRSRVDRVIENHGDKTELERLVQLFWKESLHGSEESN